MTTSPDFEKALSLKPQIALAYEAVVKAEQNSLNEKIKLGELLNLAKEAVTHGAWTNWLIEHFPKISHRSANVYMDLAAKKDTLDAKSNPQRAAILAAGKEMSLRQALKEIRTPEEIKKAEVKKAQAKATKEATKAAKAAETARPPGGSGSVSLDDLIPASAPDEVFEVLRDNWEERDLTKLTNLLAEYLAEIKGSPQHSADKASASQERRM
jgi:hypothetical protein